MFINIYIPIYVDCKGKLDLFKIPSKLVKIHGFIVTVFINEVYVLTHAVFFVKNGSLRSVGLQNKCNK